MFYSIFIRLSGNVTVIGFQLSVAFLSTILLAITEDITAASLSVFLVGLISGNVTFSV